jgi:peptidoglycan/LPS O-acetylase OafA/YrhL
MVVIGTTLMLLSFWTAHMFGYKHWHTFRLLFMFFSGSVFWVFRDRIPMNGWLFAVLFAALLAGGAVPRYFFWVYPLTIAYVVLWLAYVPGGWIRGFNRLGDYSYGIYIYAYPVQQMLFATIPGITPVEMILGAAASTIALAMLSWHFVEKPMLARKGGKPHAPPASSVGEQQAERG